MDRYLSKLLVSLVESSHAKLDAYLFTIALWVLMVKSNDYKYRKKLTKHFNNTSTSITTTTIATDSKLRDIPLPKLLKDVSIPEVYLHQIKNLNEIFESRKVENNTGSIGYNQIIEDDYVLHEIVRKKNSNKAIEAFIRAGPRKILHFDYSSQTINAAICTCGGLCPGLNNVIRELVHGLTYLYPINKIYGVKGGYDGFQEKTGYEPIELNVNNTDTIHHQGGTILASSRGGFDLNAIIRFLIKYNISQLYIIGGDGTHRGIHRISEEVLQHRLNCSVVGIPKTIDNDIDIIDRSFGFNSSVEASQAAINSAKVEAKCNVPNGIGIVKLMGRSAGFVAAHATLGSGDVDLCLVPEIKIILDGDNGILPFLYDRVKEKGHAVVVVAEGAGEHLFETSHEKDASGNKKLPEIGPYMKEQIIKYFKKKNTEATVKYIEPSYMIRSVPANASDALLCMLLAQIAVHGAMAGFTGFSVGLVNNRVVYIPIKRLTATSPSNMHPNGRTWERVMALTLQPHAPPVIDITSTNITLNSRVTI